MNQRVSSLRQCSVSWERLRVITFYAASPRVGKLAWRHFNRVDLLNTYQPIFERLFKREPQRSRRSSTIRFTTSAFSG